MRRVILVLVWVFTFELSFSQHYDRHYLETKIDSMFQDLNKKPSPGIAVTLIKDSQILFKKSYGLASLEHNVPFTHQSVVRLPYAETREFISIAAVMMEEEGLIKLTDRINRYFPKLPAWSASVTIKDLLNHRSGFVDEWAVLLLTQSSMNNRFDKSQFLDLLYNQPRPEVEPTKGYMYCNSDFGLLRLILEKASSENLSKWMERKLFAPLGMKDTRLHDNKNEAIPNFAMQYYMGPGVYIRWTEDKTSPGGNYYVAMTAEDVEKWDAVHKNNQSNISRMVMRLKEGAQLMPGEGTNYIFGLKEKTVNGYRVISHQGVNDRPYLTHIPELKISIIAVGNDSFEDYSRIHKGLMHLLLGKGQAKEEAIKTFVRAPVTYTPSELSQFAGRYFDKDTVTYESFVFDRKNVLRFEVAGNELNLHYGNETPLRLIPFAKNVFKDPDYEAYLEFEPSPRAGGATRLTTYVHLSQKVHHHVKDTTEMWNPSPSELTEFHGKFYSAHLDFYWTILSEDKGQLIIRRPTIAQTALLPDRKDVFSLMVDKNPDNSFEVMVKFFRNKKGAITHFTVSDPRLKDHRFDKVK